MKLEVYCRNKWIITTG